MTFRTRKHAIDDFRDRMAEIISCISHEPLVPLPDGARSSLLFRGRSRFVRLSGGIEPLRLSIIHRVRFVPEDDGRWRVSTVSYAYDIQRQRDDVNVPKVVIEFHYHPEAPHGTAPGARDGWVSYPHLHAETNLSVVTRRSHILTGRISLESVVRFLITQLAVDELRVDWQDILAKTEESFLSSWPH